MGQLACVTGVRYICCQVGALEAVERDTRGPSSTFRLLVGGSRRQEAALSLSSEIGA